MNGALGLKSGAGCNFSFWFHESFMKLIRFCRITQAWECRIKQGSDDYIFAQVSHR